MYGFKNGTRLRAAPHLLPASFQIPTTVDESLCHRSQHQPTSLFFPVGPSALLNSESCPHLGWDCYLPVGVDNSAMAAHPVILASGAIRLLSATSSLKIRNFQWPLT